MRLHIWLGLLAIPLAVVHSGVRLFGGVLSVSTWTVWLFLATSASGIWGLVVQQFLPRRLFDEIPEETVAAGIDHLMSRYAKDARELVEALTLALGEPAPEDGAGVRRQPPASARWPAVRRPATANLLRRRARAVPGGAQPDIAPALRGAGARPLRGAVAAVPGAAQQHTRRLEHFCEARRQADRQKRLQFFLSGWLWVHVPLSAALLVFLVWHAVAAMKWW